MVRNVEQEKGVQRVGQWKAPQTPPPLSESSYRPLLWMFAEDDAVLQCGQGRGDYGRLFVIQPRKAVERNLNMGSNAPRTDERTLTVSSFGFEAHLPVCLSACKRDRFHRLPEHGSVDPSAREQAFYYVDPIVERGE